MSARFRIVALVAFSLSFNLTTAQQTPQQIGSAKTADKLVFSVTVTNKKGELVTGLLRSNFHLTIDKTPANIIDFGEYDLPLSVGIVFDASGSVVSDRMSDKAVRALMNSWAQSLKGLLENGHSANEYFLMVFNDKPRLLLDWASEFKAITERVGVVKPKGNLAFYDACLLAIDKFRHGRHSKRVLILITDGQDNASTHSLAQVREELRASDVLVYSVFLGAEIVGSALNKEGQGILDLFSVLVGGRFFYSGEQPTTSKVTSISYGLAQELRSQYTIALTPNLPLDNKWHKIKIKVETDVNAQGDMNIERTDSRGFLFESEMRLKVLQSHSRHVVRHKSSYQGFASGSTKPPFRGCRPQP